MFVYGKSHDQKLSVSRTTCIINMQTYGSSNMCAKPLDSRRWICELRVCFFNCWNTRRQLVRFTVHFLGMCQFSGATRSAATVVDRTCCVLSRMVHFHEFRVPVHKAHATRRIGRTRGVQV